MANRPPRLERLFAEYQAPLWYISFNTWQRQKLLAHRAVHHCFQSFSTAATFQDLFVGRYVLMPDHLHLFVAGPRDFDLPAWVRMLKLSLSPKISAKRPHWQESFLDHLVRHEESYQEKWDYVRQNPVAAGLVAIPTDWPYQGEINDLPFE